MRFFRPLKSEPKPCPVAAMDTEGNGAHDGFVCAAVVSDRGRFFFTDRQSTLDYLLSPEMRGYRIFAHNLEYDLATLTGGDLRQFRCLFSQRGIIYAEVRDAHRHTWRFLDSTNIFVGASIGGLGEMVGRQKHALEPLLEACLRNGIPFYELSDEGQRKIRAYCYADADILYQAIVELQEELNSLGGELKSTAAGCAMDLYRRKFMRQAWPVLDPDLNRLARQAYYGARNEPYRLGRIEHVNGYDVSSLYPSIMATANFPHPNSLHFDLQPRDTTHVMRREGVSQAVVHVPGLDPAPLPQRYGMKLFFPQGHLHGAWTHTELRHALEAGCTIQSIDWTIWSGYSFNPFEDFIDKLYSLKVLYASSSSLREHFFKQMLNASYGRYGINPDSGLSELVAIVSDDQFDELVGSTLHWINNIPYALRPLDSEQLPAYANAMIAAYISAGSRIKMFDWIKETIGDLCYTDTDSLWLAGSIPTREGLGEMRQTHEDMSFWVVAPKEYAVFSGEALIEAHAKGIPEQYRLEYLESGQVSFDQPVKVREAARRHESPGVWLETLKRRQYQFPKRAPLPSPRASLDYFETQPWQMEELRFHLGSESGRHHFQGLRG